MSLDEALRFWKSEFTRIMDGDKVMMMVALLQYLIALITYMTDIETVKCPSTHRKRSCFR